MADSTPNTTRVVLVAVAAPVTIVAIAAITQLAMVSRVPDPIAIHWAADGSADGFGPAWTNLVVLLALGLVGPLAIASVVLRGLRHRGGGSNYRLLGSFALGLAVDVAVLTTWLLAMQVDLSSAADAPSPVVPLVGSLFAGLGAGLAGWRLLPSMANADHQALVPDPLPLAPGSRAVWVRSVTMGRAAIAIGVTVLALAVVAIGLWVTGPPATAFLVTGLTLLLAGIAAATTAFRVRVDARGLSVRSTIGWPRFHVAITDVAAVGVIDVDPIGDFGGYGLRGLPRRFGVVMRRGAAITVTRRNGHNFVITVDDAVTGAALLRSLAGVVADGDEPH